MVLSCIESDARSGALAWGAELNRVGLPTHEVTGGDCGDFVGISFDGSAHTLQISTARGWKFRLALLQAPKQSHAHTVSRLNVWLVILLGWLCFAVVV